MPYRVRLEKEHHVFSAAHFITFNGDVCERLHGHNYRVAVEVEGPLDENQYVIDFIALRDELKAITDELDHHMLLPTGHPLIRVTAGDQRSRSRLHARRPPLGLSPRRLRPPAGQPTRRPSCWPTTSASDCSPPSSAAPAMRPARLQVAVDENHGQWGICELT